MTRARLTLARARLTKIGVFTPRTRTRAADPQTSTDAAARVDMTEIQRRVLIIAASSLYQIGLTHSQAIAHYRRIYGEQTAESTIRTRVSELVDLGLMLKHGTRTTGDKTETLWILTGKGRLKCLEMQA